jgi:DNA-binding transcriptional ArsR family regulator
MIARRGAADWRGQRVGGIYNFTVTPRRDMVIVESRSPMPGTIPDELLDVMAEKFRMLADPTRLAILRTLMAGERSVGQVVDETGRGQANVSKHLKLLTEAGLLARRKTGLQVFYRVNDPLVEQLCTLVCQTIIRDVEDDVRRSQALLKSITPGAAPKPRRGGPKSTT